jgi:hypothetical protein
MKAMFELNYLDEVPTQREPQDTLPELPLRLEPGTSLDYHVSDRHVEVTNYAPVDAELIVVAIGKAKTLEIPASSTGSFSLPQGPGLVENRGQVDVLLAFRPW